MQKYVLVFRLAAQELFQYRFDFLASTVKYALMVLMMTLVWLAVAKENPDLPLTNQETIRYFFFSAVLFSLSNFHTNYIEDDIRLGSMNKFLLKPISAFAYYFWYESAPAVIETSIKLLVMLPLLWLLGFGFSVSVPHLALAILFFPVVFTCAFTLYSTISGLAFWITEAFALRWSITIIIRFLSGILIPISFLPAAAQSIMYWLPFEHLAYTPIQLLQAKISLNQGLTAFFILVTWTIIIQAMRYIVWQAGYKQFEGSGI